MYDKVSQPYIEIYDGATNKYLGRAVFKVTSEVEKAILNYARNERQPKRVVLQDVYFYPASSDFIAPLPFQRHSYQGVIKVMLRDRYSELWTPVEIRARFNILERTQPSKEQYHFASVEFSVIVIEGVTAMPKSTTGLRK
ncbi:MAG: hypothetical protein VB071_07045 [Lawsonibacter sp.]|nr:hypothetical protein [Lawsonibacter sp.]